MDKLAVIGSGISGLSAAWALRDMFDVTVFEQEPRIGGHANTITIDYDGVEMAVDVGFIVCNPLNYPNFMPFLKALGVETQAGDMSFAVSDPKGYEWSSNGIGLFAKKRNILNPFFISMLLNILAFNKRARADVDAGLISKDLTLGAYLDRVGFGERFKKNYILPMGAAIWSTPEAGMADYPALSFLNFFNNHKLLHYDRPQWRTVQNGSQTYVNKLIEALGSRIKTATKIERLNRATDGIQLSYHDRQETFDHVVLAGHAPQSRTILQAGFERQKDALSSIHTVPNRAVLHKDAGLMPKRKAAWAAWNVLKGEGDKVSLTYWMNALQKLDSTRPIFVTLNPETPPKDEDVFGTFDFAHPLFTLEMKTGVEALKGMNGRDGLWFAGAWMGHGFHEDGLKSGLRVARSLGAELPWDVVDADPYPQQEAALVK